MRRVLLCPLVILLLGGCSLPRLIVLHDPLDAPRHNDLGVAYEQRGETDLAQREYERAAQLDTRWAQPLINRGNVLAARRDWVGAQQSYRQALRREPGSAEAMNNLAWVLLQGGEREEALAWAEKAQASEPRQPAVLDTLAEIHLARGAYPEARRAIEQALSLGPDAALRAGLERKRSILPEE